MTDIAKAGTFLMGDRKVHRMGYGAMQLAGPGVFGPPKDHAQALAVLREAVAAGGDHLLPRDFYRRPPGTPPSGARPWRGASTTSTPATSTGRTSPTRSSPRRCIPIRTT